LNESVLICCLFLYDRLQVTVPTEIQFDGWTLHTRSGELLHDGNTHRLAQQPLRVLIELLEHSGEVVIRERLVELLWPKGVVDFDNSLNAVIRKLRVVLKDESETPRYIETLPRIGYRFIAKVTGPIQTPPLTPPFEPAKAERSNQTRYTASALILALAALAGTWWFLHGDRQSPPAVAEPADIRKTSQRAYDLYLNGKYHRSRRDVNANPIAIEQFRAALQEDPYFADAWAALSETYIGSGTQQQMVLKEAMQLARETALRAVELDPKTAAGHSALGMIKMYYDADFAEAEKEFILARNSDDRYARLWHGYAILRGFQGRADEAFEYIGRARELEPMTLLYTASHAHLLYYTRRYAEAIEFVRPILASQPRFDQARTILIRSLLKTGDTKGAIEQLSLRYADVPLLSDDGLVYAQAGQREEALRQIERLERHKREGFGVSYEIAIINAALGQLDKACTALRAAFEDHSPTLGWLRLDPRMDPLRQDPCYAETERRLYGTTRR
jgi:DNA-binding winged helix-turn-helix (wHTH) protein/Flp pilus assembly protein TadD